MDGDGTIHVLGDNGEGGLGTGDLIDVTFWSKVGAACSAGFLNGVAYISTFSRHDYRVNSSAILITGTVRSWGSNSKQAITTGDESLITCPIKPTGNNKNAVAISNGGHISPYVNTNIQICNIGHNKDGAFGDGNDENGDYGEYICNTIPGMPEICGTKEANLALEKNVNDIAPRTGDDVVFTITVTNNGPEPSTGSFVRDKLESAFYYLSDDSSGAYDSKTGLWIVGPLAVNESKTINIVVKVIDFGAQTNYAQIFVDNEVDINSTPGDYSGNQDDDDLVVLNVLPCPIEISEIVLCPYDSISINNEWVYSAGLFIESTSLTADCDSLHITKVEFIEEPPVPKLTVDCENREFNLNIDENTIWKPQWDNGDNSFSAIYSEFNESALLSLDTDPNCKEEIIIKLPILSDIEDIPFFNDTLILQNTILELPTGLNSDEWNLQWTPEEMFECPTCIEGFLMGSENSEITLFLEHKSSCVFESSFQLRIEKEPQHIFAANILTSNNDSYNDEWIVFSSPNITIESCNVYDRWGNLVYYSEELIPSWNGNSNGSACGQGVYVYMIKYLDRDGVRQIESGDVTLIR